MIGLEALFIVKIALNSKELEYAPHSFTALRDINDLLTRGVLCRMEGGGHSTGYELLTK